MQQDIIVAERSVLGAILLDPKFAMPIATAILTPASFLDQTNSDVFAAMITLFNQDKPIDIVTLLSLLGTEISPSELSNLSSAVPTSANVEHYATQVQDAYRQRQIRNMAKRLYPSAGNADDLYADAVAALDGIDQPARTNKQTGEEELGGFLKDVISGAVQEVDFPWPELSRQTKALLPGTTTLICGAPGATKTFMLLECLMHWHKAGIPVAAYMLEEDRKYYLYRVLSQLQEDSRLYDYAYIRANPDYTLEAKERHRDVINSFANCIHCPEGKGVKLTDLPAWIRIQARAGCRVIAIDPITGASVSDKRWNDDAQFVDALRTMVPLYNTSVILTTHPKKSGKAEQISLDDLSGGAAFQRLLQTVIWLDHHDPKEAAVYLTGSVTIPEQINRTIYIKKARNGIGSGQQIGFWFEPRTLRLAERGRINREAKTQGKPTKYNKNQPKPITGNHERYEEPEGECPF